MTFHLYPPASGVLEGLMQRIGRHQIPACYAGSGGDVLLPHMTVHLLLAVCGKITVLGLLARVLSPYARLLF